MIEIIQDDITRLEVDAIVNAANEGLRGGGGVDGAIHRAAGPGLLDECRRFDACRTGSAVITGGHRLPAKHVIHAVGPRYRDGRYGEPGLLRSAYEKSFALARENHLRSIAFPAIATGVYRYPKEQAARIALETMILHEPYFDRIVACVFDDEGFALYQRTLAELRSASA